MSCVNGGEAAYLSEVSDNKDCYIMTKFDNYLKSLETNDWKKKFLIIIQKFITIV